MSPAEIGQVIAEHWWTAFRMTNIALSMVFIIMAIKYYPSWIREPFETRIRDLALMIYVVVNMFATADLYFREVEGGARIYFLTGATLFALWSIWAILRKERRERRLPPPPSVELQAHEDSEEHKAYRAAIIQQVERELEAERTSREQEQQ